MAAVAFAVVSIAASNDSSAAGTYKIEFDNAFGLVTGADFKVAGVPAGTIKSISLDQKTLDAVVTIQVTQTGFGPFHADAFCQSRPQSLIGEYFVDCQPGEHGPVLAPEARSRSHTQSTVPELERSLGATPGWKYVDLHKGISKELIPDGGTLAITQTTVPVQFDEIFQTFNPPPAERSKGSWSASETRSPVAAPR